MHPDGIGGYAVQIRLRRNDAKPRLGETETGYQALMGDSEIALDGYAEAATDFLVGNLPLAKSAFVQLQRNEHGRVGAILVTVEASRTWDAYLVAQSTFNRIAVAVAVGWCVPLRHDGMQITRFKGDETSPEIDESALVLGTSYPTMPAILTTDFPKVLTHLYASFAEGIRTNSPFYALLCFFTLTEFMTTTLQGRLRRINTTYRIEYVDLKGTVSPENSRHIEHSLIGMSYSDLLVRTRDVRDSIAHFIMDLNNSMPRPFDAVGEDQVYYFRDALKIASRDLLAKLEVNIARFIEAGATDNLLVEVFEGKFPRD